MEHFVREFLETPAGMVPQVETSLDWRDQLGRIRVRLGFFRDEYRIAPGLYCVGSPDQDSPVLVTANYKLSFDVLRADLSGQNCWILVLDTRGINVWCASAHKTFGTAELVARVRAEQLGEVVRHRKLIVPQLGASGVAAGKVKKDCGFEVVWGPIRSSDIREFIAAGNQATPAMRQLTFLFPERIVLSPVELTLSLKPAMITLAVIYVLSGIGPDIFSFADAWQRFVPAAFSLFAGLLAGAALVPAILPWLPFRSFYLKGVFAAVPVVFLIETWICPASGYQAAALISLGVAVSSFTAMNYTGATPYASPSGVEKEMKHAIPFQVLLVLAAAVLWVVARFV